uniref:Uncharacterized protein n=1 Tax=Oryza nivara TaxID=4536 RepID=A0A0E0IIS2_ORYNI
MVARDVKAAATRASGSKRTAMGEAAADRALSHLHDVREFIRNSVSTHVNELVSIFQGFDRTMSLVVLD